ncbi:hypothetical protein FF1_017889 [Malus domestica]
MGEQRKCHPTSTTRSVSKCFSFFPFYPSLCLCLGARMNAFAATSYASALADVANSNNTLKATSGNVEKIEKFLDD